MLGESNVRAMGQKLGLSPEAISTGLAGLLPMLVDQLTPRGQGNAGVDVASAMSALRGRLTS